MGGYAMKGYCIGCIGASIGAAVVGMGTGAVRVAGADRVAPGVMGSDTVHGVAGTMLGRLTSRLVSKRGTPGTGPGSGAGGAVMVPGGTAGTGASMTRMVAAGDTNTVGVG